MQAEMDKVKNMSDEERKAYFESKKDSKGKADISAELVEKGIITQEQADAVKQVIGMGSFKDGRQGGARPQGRVR